MASPVVEPQLEPGATLVAVAVVGRRQPRIAHVERAVAVEQRRPHGFVAVLGALGADGAEGEREPLVRPRRDGSRGGDAAPVGLAPGVTALAEAADLGDPT